MERENQGGWLHLKMAIKWVYVCVYVYVSFN